MAPKIYSRIKTTRKDGSHVAFRIQEMRDQDKEEVVKFAKQFFIPYEIYLRASGVSTSPTAREEFLGFVNKLLESDRCTPLLAVVDYEDPNKIELVGCNLFLVISKKTGAFPTFQTEECKKLFGIVEEFIKLYDVIAENDVEECLSGAGLSVHPNFTGCGIATELLKARRILIKDRVFPITSAWFTSIGSQRAATKAGFEVKSEISHDDLGQRLGFKYDYAAPTSQFMVAKPITE